MDTPCFSLGEWQTESGQDGDSLSANAGFVSAPDDVHLDPASPCVDSGTDVGLSMDPEGQSIPQGTAPDIGVYEQ